MSIQVISSFLFKTCFFLVLSTIKLKILTFYFEFLEIPSIFLYYSPDENLTCLKAGHYNNMNLDRKNKNNIKLRRFYFIFVNFRIKFSLIIDSNLYK